MIKYEGKAGISATIIQDSVNKFGKRIITYELVYHRYIHSEFMTHRMFSRNAASSRAIPVDKMHEIIRSNPATPITWQKNQPGMQSKEELEGISLEKAQQEWRIAVEMAIESSTQLITAGLHKQWSNRVTEFAQMMKTVMTTTEDMNWEELRFHPDAQPEIHELARCIIEAKKMSAPKQLEKGEWHVPYVNRVRRYANSALEYQDSSGKMLTTEEAIMVSASCCAQVSYRKSDESLDKAKSIYDRLINSVPQHASPIEHQATPMDIDKYIFSVEPKFWESGVTHVNRKGTPGSGNFYGWIQYRQLLNSNK